MYSRPIGLIFALFCMGACTVLENRGECPCQIRLDLTSQTLASFDSVAVCVSVPGGGESRIYSVGRDRYAEGFVVETSCRDSVFISVFPADMSPYFKNGCLTLPLGSDCPQLYSYAGVCDTSADTCTVGVVMHKNHCRVSLRFVAWSPGSYACRVQGSFCGYHADGKPMQGDFSYALHFDMNGMAYFNLPRQGDSSLELEVTGADGSRSHFAIGNMIEQSGYDWSAEDLRDITLTLDYATAMIGVGGSWWELEKFVRIVV